MFPHNRYSYGNCGYLCVNTFLCYIFNYIVVLYFVLWNLLISNALGNKRCFSFFSLTIASHALTIWECRKLYFILTLMYNSCAWIKGIEQLLCVYWPLHMFCLLCSILLVFMLVDCCVLKLHCMTKLNYCSQWYIIFLVNF